MLTHAALFVAGLIILLISTNHLIASSKALAYKFKISPLVIGITVLALGTSLPELAVSTIAAANRDYGLALGNIVGSNISNILFVLPIGILVGKLRVGTFKTQKTINLLIAVTLGYFLFHYINRISPPIAVALILFGVATTLIEYKWGNEGRSHEDKFHFLHIHKQVSPFSAITVPLLLICLAGISFGGILIVSSVEKLAIAFNISTTFLGLTLTALATSLPELVATIFTQNTNDEKLTLGNIIGSNIYNIAIIGGMGAFFYTGASLSALEWLWFLYSAFILLLVIKVFSGKFIPKAVGVVMLMLFVGYLATLAFS